MPDINYVRSEIERMRTQVQRGRAGAGEGPRPRRSQMVSEPLRWDDDKADNPPWIRALAEVRRLAPREGWCYQHVQAIILSIDQYAEKALGNRDLLSEPAPQHRRIEEERHPQRWLGW